MKTLLRKELRENLKPAALGLMVFTVLVVGSWRYYTGMMQDAAQGMRSASGYSHRLQPLTTPLTLAEAVLLCAVFGTLLGWIQIRREQHRDLWAFLVHRPTDRTTIYLGKVMAGLAVYLTVVGLPLSCYIVWAAIPGRVAAPFQWEMIWPFFTAFLAGVAFYFAGMLTALREVRWYGSRAWGLGMALFVGLMGMQATWPLWQILVFMLAGITILAAAAWGAFLSHGQYQGQSIITRMALAGSLVPGAITLVFIVAAGLISALPFSSKSGRWSTYVLGQDGIIYQETRGGNQPSEVADLNGKQLVNPQTGHGVQPSEFSSAPWVTWIDVDRGSRRPKDDYPRTWFNFWREDQGTLWFYWTRYGRMVGYDIPTRRFIGSFGPKGFTADVLEGGDRFDTPTQYYNFPDSPLTIATPTTLYKVDIRNRQARPVFTADADDSILTRTDINAYGREWDKNTVVATKHYLILFKPDGTTAWKVPYEPPYPESNRILIFFLENSGEFVLWFDPSTVANRRAGWALSTHVVWVEPARGVVKTVNLPNLALTGGPGITEKLLALLLPAPFWPVFYWQENRDWSWVIPWKMVYISLAGAAIICIPLGWWLGRRYNFTFAQQLGWAVFHLIFNLPGLLTFLGVQEWPARVPCPQCHKLRVIDREHCEHCDAEFAPPEKNGTEIFEPLGEPVDLAVR
jgi:hypothetical protein